MFDSIGWGEILVLVVAGLFILGPERLPDAAAWLGKTVRQVKGYASGAREQLRGELGPEFDELRKPLNELRDLRGWTLVGRSPVRCSRSSRTSSPTATRLARLMRCRSGTRQRSRPVNWARTSGLRSTPTPRNG